MHMKSSSTHTRPRVALRLFVAPFAAFVGFATMTGCEDSSSNEAVDEAEEAVEELGDEIEEAADG